MGGLQGSVIVRGGGALLYEMEATSG